MREIGERLQARARELGLTDAEVARRLGLAQGRYSNYVNANREPDLATLVRICRELAITPDELLGFREGDADRATGMRARIDSLLDGLEQGKMELVFGLLSVVARDGSPPPPEESVAPVRKRRPRPV